jgi:O-antigen/teichoic acid export membrane protein
VIVWTISKEPVEPFAVADMVAFGLVIHSSNINEVNRLRDEDERWKTVHNGASIVFILVYGLLFFAAISPPKNFNYDAVINITIILSVVSFALGLSVLLRSNLNERIGR